MNFLNFIKHICLFLFFLALNLNAAIKTFDGQPLILHSSSNENNILRVNSTGIGVLKDAEYNLDVQGNASISTNLIISGDIFSSNINNSVGNTLLSLPSHGNLQTFTSAANLFSSIETSDNTNHDNNSVGTLSIQGGLSRGGFFQARLNSDLDNVTSANTLEFKAQDFMDPFYYEHSEVSDSANIIIQHTGLYKFNLIVCFDIDTSNNDKYIEIWAERSGVEIVPSRVRSNADKNMEYDMINSTFIAQLSKDDEINIKVLTNDTSSNPPDITSDQTWVLIEKI